MRMASNESNAITIETSQCAQDHPKGLLVETRRIVSELINESNAECTNIF